MTSQSGVGKHLTNATGIRNQTDNSGPAKVHSIAVTGFVTSLTDALTDDPGALGKILKIEPVLN